MANECLKNLPQWVWLVIGIIIFESIVFLLLGVGLITILLNNDVYFGNLKEEILSTINKMIQSCEPIHYSKFNIETRTNE